MLVVLARKPGSSFSEKTKVFRGTPGWTCRSYSLAIMSNPGRPGSRRHRIWSSAENHRLGRTDLLCLVWQLPHEQVAQGYCVVVLEVLNAIPQVSGDADEPCLLGL